jgi:hypothetical protein
MAPGTPDHLHHPGLLGIRHGRKNRQANNLFGYGMGYR